MITIHIYVLEAPPPVYISSSISIAKRFPSSILACYTFGSLKPQKAIHLNFWISERPLASRLKHGVSPMQIGQDPSLSVSWTSRSNGRSLKYPDEGTHGTLPRLMAGWQ
ncbi:hypothetical protein GQ44DRAFT_718389 [Phaeosphaeriaceae sp. PMI808]|nr:hypothetical protein GQ44DRAFT_718389 [Phaeosphaeriaceae sp. PMI808]